MRITKKKIYIIGITIVVLFIVSSKGFRNLIKRKIELSKIEKELLQIEEENKQLTNEIRMLEKDKTYQEYLIRRELGYIKPDEIEYRFKKPLEKNSK